MVLGIEVLGAVGAQILANLGSARIKGMLKRRKQNRELEDAESSTTPVRISSQELEEPENLAGVLERVERLDQSQQDDSHHGHIRRLDVSRQCSLDACRAVAGRADQGRPDPGRRWSRRGGSKARRASHRKPRESCQSKTARHTAPKPAGARAMQDRWLMADAAEGRARSQQRRASQGVGLRRLDCPASAASGREPARCFDDSVITLQDRTLRTGRSHSQHAQTVFGPASNQIVPVRSS